MRKKSLIGWINGDIFRYSHFFEKVNPAGLKCSINDYNVWSRSDKVLGRTTKVRITIEKL